MSGDINWWMQSANRYPLLRPDEEIHLATLVRTWLDSEDPTPQQVRAGRRAKDRMIHCNLRLAAKVAFGFRARLEARGIEMEDALQESIIGLNRAAEKFDPERGYKFSTYATLWLRQSVMRILLIQGSAIKIPTTAQDIEKRWKYKGEQTMEEFCNEWNYKPEKVIEELQKVRMMNCKSLDARVNGDPELSTLLDIIPSRDVDTLESIDVIDAVASLRECPEARDDIALIELAEMHSNKDIGELLNIPSRSAVKTLRDAREQLRQLVPSHVARELAVA